MPYAEYVQRAAASRRSASTRTSFEPEQPAATGYLVQPYVEGVWDAGAVETGAWIAAGQMWGTVGDLCRWARVPRRARRDDPDEDERRGDAHGADDRRPRPLDARLRARPRSCSATASAILAGHGGSMPGFIAGVYVSPADKVGVAALTNSSSAALGELAQRSLRTTVERWPVPPEPWRVGEPPPDDVVPLLGIWFMEARRLVFRWRDGKLEARFPDAADWEPSCGLRARDRRPLARRLRLGARRAARIVRRGGRPRVMLAGYPVTRAPGTV